MYINAVIGKILSAISDKSYIFYHIPEVYAMVQIGKILNVFFLDTVYLLWYKSKDVKLQAIWYRFKTI